MVLKNVRLKFTHIDKVDDNDKYSTAFFVDNKEDEKKLIDMIEAAWAEGKGDHSKDPKSLSYNEYDNDDKADDPDNGKIIFNASQNAQSSDGQYQFKVDVYDSDANLIDQDKVPAIGWGTKGDISVSTYCWTYKKEKGIKLNFEAFKIVDLVEYAGENPFEPEEEGGYKAPTNPFNQPEVSGV